jgi:hypothetical protein
MGAVFQGLKQLDHVMCAVLLQSFTDIAKIGMNFIPVGEVNVVKDAVESAKTMVENSLGSQGLDGVCTFSPLLLGNYLLGYF